MLLAIDRLIKCINKNIAQANMPKFANSPENLSILMPRKIVNPSKIFLGNDVRLGSRCILHALTEYPGGWAHPQKNHVSQKFNPMIIIGNRVVASGSLHLAAAHKIVIEDDVMFAANVFVCDCTHGYYKTDVPYKYQALSNIAPTIIKKGSWIGQNAVILPGVTIGEFSIIGANSVVNKDIPDKCIAFGAQAKVIKSRSLSHGKWVKII
jgi:acetyltransferase-like isoleucine patch superfamily enzyme